MVDNVVWTGMAMTVEYQAVAQEGLGLNVGICLGVFYAENGMLGARDSEWLQNALNVLIGLFHLYRFVTIVANLVQCHAHL